MNGKTGDYWKRCDAIIEAGILDPESSEGIHFCVELCPYNKCIIFEGQRTKAQVTAMNRIRFAQALRKHGVSVDDIALILNKPVRTILRDLKSII